MTPAGGSAMTLVKNRYDEYGTRACSACFGGCGRGRGPGCTTMRTMGRASRFAGTVTSTSGVGGTRCTDYETTGVAKCSTVDGRVRGESDVG